MVNKKENYALVGKILVKYSFTALYLGKNIESNDEYNTQRKIRS